MATEIDPRNSLWRWRGGWMLVAFGAIAAFFLLAEHRAHVFGFLPYLLLLACPLMHLFGHGGHGGREAYRDYAERTPAFVPRLRAEPRRA